MSNFEYPILNGFVEGRKRGCFFSSSIVIGISTSLAVEPGIAQLLPSIAKSARQCRRSCSKEGVDLERGGWLAGGNLKTLVISSES